MMRRAHLDDSDLELAAQALRSLAARYRDGAKRQSNPIVREGFEESAAECERLAERMGQLGGMKESR
jgi:hypothetical protein